MNTTNEFQHGVEYHHSTVKTNTLSVDKLEESSISQPYLIYFLPSYFLDNLIDIGYIRFQWVDFTNIIRVRILPLSYFKKLLDGNRPGITLPKVLLGAVYHQAAPGFTAMGEYFLTPDLSTIRPCPYEPGHASLMGWFEEKAGVADPQGQPIVQVDLCPRGMLRRIVQ